MMAFQRGGLPWRVSMAQAKSDFDYSYLPLSESLKIHPKDARLEAALSQKDM
jgi:hypothetical protein